MTRVVLDSWALLAHLWDEPAGARVAQLLDQAMRGDTELLISTVNVGEILYRLQREAGVDRADEVAASLEAMPVELVAVDLKVARIAARLKAVTPVAFADCFAVALAILRDAWITTGDPEFARFGEAVRILWLIEPPALPR